MIGGGDAVKVKYTGILPDLFSRRAGGGDRRQVFGLKPGVRRRHGAGQARRENAKDVADRLTAQRLRR
ncbi:hypothetical protein [Rhizobium tibeticum]|uniref:hypothetical protein n=1 Tax=Rhizobium tibeticum TaxID=501024 RepID=UPI000930565D|nr:hypothetical protein [Rhizobium tibeticum]